MIHKPRLIFNEKYHDNCHDYLKRIYIDKYAPSIYRPLLYEIRDNIPKIDICHDTRQDNYGRIIVCDQHGMIFGHHLDDYPILATYALNACVGLIFHLPKYMVAALAHIDGLPGYSQQSAINDGVDIDFNPVNENLRIMMRILKGLSGDYHSNAIYVDYYLIGGIFDLSEIMIHDIIESINNMKNTQYKFTFRGRNILGPENQSRNICIDTRTGKITYFDYVLNSEFETRRNNNGLPLNIIKAPRQSEALLDITYIPVK
jgi:hypothetical protein